VKYQNIIEKFIEKLSKCAFVSLRIGHNNSSTHLPPVILRMWTFKVQVALLTPVGNFPLTLSRGTLDKASLSKYFPSELDPVVRLT